MQKTRCQSWGAFLARHPMPSNYRGCVCSFWFALHRISTAAATWPPSISTQDTRHTTHSDPAALSPSLSIWPDLLALDGVFGAFGIHPHNARYYNARLEDAIVHILTEQPKAVAWGEIGLGLLHPHSHHNTTQQPIKADTHQKANRL